MRPKSVVLFENLFLASLGLGVIQLALIWGPNWNTLMQTTDAMGNLALGAFSLILLLILVLVISRKGVNVVRKVLLVFFVLGAFGYIRDLVVIFEENPVWTLIPVVQFPLQAIALWLVFRPDANPWFEKSMGEIEA